MAQAVLGLLVTLSLPSAGFWVGEMGHLDNMASLFLSMVVVPNTAETQILIKLLIIIYLYTVLFLMFFLYYILVNK